MDVESGPVLVTGAAGFIGSHVVEALLQRGARVVGVDNFDPYYDAALKRANVEACRRAARGAGGEERYEPVEADICDAEALGRLVERSRPAAIFHLAAKAGVRPSIADPVGYARVNVVGTASVLEAAKTMAELAERQGRPRPRIVVASSSSVYGNNPVVPFSEEHAVDGPISPYASTKRSCELICHTHHHLTGMPTACLRFFTVYGPRQRPDLAISSFLRRVGRGEPIPMFGDGSSSRDYTYIADIVAGVLAAHDRIGAHGYRIWNLGGSDPVTLRELIALVGRVVGREPRIEPRPSQPGDVERTFADLTRSAAELGFRPRTALAEGIERQWAWMREAGLA